MNTKTAMITIAGRPNVGKSTLTNYLVGEKIAIVSNKPQTTRNRICGIVTRGNLQFVFMDTPGYHKARTKLGDYMVNTVRESITDVDLTLLVVEPIASVGSQEEALIEKIHSSHRSTELARRAICPSLQTCNSRIRRPMTFLSGYRPVLAPMSKNSAKIRCSSISSTSFSCRGL